MKRALITGITGQDGSYLAELLLDKDYEVHGIIRRASWFNTARIDHVFDHLHLHYGDLTDALGMLRTIQQVEPDEIYNLGAQSHVQVSFQQPAYTTETIVQGTLNVLEAARTLKKCPRIYQASSSEMYGDVLETPQTEKTPFNPVSPYGVAKVAAHQMCTTYRQSYGMPISCGILFNHESPRRTETFVTRKITKAAARMKLGKQDKLYLGNLGARRDWGFAVDYVDAMWRMLQEDDPDDMDDYVIATGVSVTVKYFLEAVFECAGLDLDRVVIDPKYFRPTEVRELLGDSSKARARLGWEPEYSVEELAQVMYEYDLRDLGGLRQTHN